MYFVYILYSEKDTNLYVGCTSDLDERIKRHNSGQVLATKDRQPLVCIHSESYELKADAFNRERFLKSLFIPLRYFVIVNLGLNQFVYKLVARTFCLQNVLGGDFGFDAKNMMYVLYRDCSSTRKH